jgi:nucleotide-binding universal stress UspA family protein
MDKGTPVFGKILIAYDGSPQSERAVEVGLRLAAQIDARVLVYSVVRPPEPAARVELNAILDDAKEHYSANFSRLRQLAADHSLSIDTEIAVGHPAEHIVHRAEEVGVNLIVMGRRGQSSFHRWMLGSISERVLRYAHCPVMVVH